MSETTEDAVEILDPVVIAGLRDLGGDEFISDLVGILCEDLPRHLSDLRAAIGDKDHAAVMAIAHSQKSSCAQLGARLMSQLFRELEAAGRARDDAEPILTRIEAEWTRVRSALESLTG